MLRVMNSNFKIIDTLKKYTFAQYEDKFREIGTFKVLAQLVKENNYLFDKKNSITFCLMNLQSERLKK